MSRVRASHHFRFAPALVWGGVFLAVVSAESAIAFDHLRVATVVLLLTAGALVWYAGIAPFTARVFALALTLVPLLRVVSLGLPLGLLSSYVWPLLVYVPALAALAAVFSRLGLAPAEANITGAGWRWQLGIGFLGVPLGGFVYLLLQPAPLAETAGEAAVGVLSLCLAGALDEAIFRGLLQETAIVALGRPGIFYVSGLYAALQIESRSLTTVAVAFAMSIGFAWIVRRTRSVLGVAVAHIVANLGLYLVLPALALRNGR